MWHRLERQKFIFSWLQRLEVPDQGLDSWWHYWMQIHLLQDRTSRPVAYAQETPELPEGFQQSAFKGQVRKGIPGSVISPCIILLLVDGDVAAWLTVSILRCQDVWGLLARDDQVVNFFHLVVFSIWKTREICMRSYSLGTSERSWGKWGKGLSLWSPAWLSEASPLGLQTTASSLWTHMGFPLSPSVYTLPLLIRTPVTLD